MLLRPGYFKASQTFGAVRNAAVIHAAESTLKAKQLPSGPTVGCLLLRRDPPHAAGAGRHLVKDAPDDLPLMR